MSDPIVNKWKQKGSVCVWQYVDVSPNYYGWHFSANRAGCDSLLDLIQLFKQAKWNAKVEVHISPATKDILKIPGVRGGDAPARSPNAIELTFSPAADPPNKWELGFRGMNLSLTLGPAMLQEFEQLVADVSRGRDDYSIGPEDRASRLWCWQWGGD